MAVYFMQPPDGGPVKIGFSDDVDHRRKTLQSQYRRPLVLLATMPGGRPEESEIHARFDHLRFPGTEQFRPAPELMEFIGCPLLVGLNPDAVEAMPSVGDKNGRVTIANLKGSQEFREWMDNESKETHRAISTILRMGLAEYARKYGRPRPPVDEAD